MGVDYFNSIDHDWVQVFLFIYLLSALNLHVFCWTIQREFFGFIDLMSSSTYEILFTTIMYDFFYFSSYCNFFYLALLIIVSPIIFIHLLSPLWSLWPNICAASPRHLILQCFFLYIILTSPY